MKMVKMVLLDFLFLPWWSGFIWLPDKKERERFGSHGITEESWIFSKNFQRGHTYYYWSTRPTKECFMFMLREGTSKAWPLDPTTLCSIYSLIGRTDAEVETPILWPLDMKSWLIGKDPDAGKDWRLEDKEMTEDEMIGWHHRCDRWVWASSRSWWWTGKPGVAKRGWTQLSDWTELLLSHAISYGVGMDSWESFGLQGDPTSPS